MNYKTEKEIWKQRADQRGHSLIAVTEERDRLRQCLEYIELTGGNYGHVEVKPGDPGVPCPCGACMANEASKALGVK